eukprot:gene4453-4701_t
MPTSLGTLAAAAALMQPPMAVAQLETRFSFCPCEDTAKQMWDGMPDGGRFQFKSYPLSDQDCLDSSNCKYLDIPK